MLAIAGLIRLDGTALLARTLNGAPPGWSRTELDALLRPVVIDKLAARHIAGAALCVVKDGRVVYAQGFGRADVDREVPVRAGETIFRIGSVTKVLTGIAVLQLADRRLLVTTYLPHRVTRAPLLPRRAADDASRFAGTWSNALYNHTRPERGGWRPHPIHIEAHADGGLGFDGAPAYRVGERTFQRDDGLLLVFEEDAAGRVERLLVRQVVYERLDQTGR